MARKSKIHKPTEIPLSKLELKARLKEKENEIAWAKSLIASLQESLNRERALVANLTQSINNLSSKLKDD